MRGAEWPPLSARGACAASFGAAALALFALAAAAMLGEPLGLREIAALVFTLGGVAVALRS
ncbi:hypothetical protein [Bradyrhizobium sp. RDI18]|uniref:hypothetical protein n=1 Tax=Bradyrhizobium sp. RDI18 TaxID=3367400 RepID=UPI003711FD49